MNSVGVVIGRFQVNELHEGHLHLLNHVKERHDHMVVFLGVRPAPADQMNPLDFQIRKGMVSQVVPLATILPLIDQPTDEGWSKTLDGLLWSLFGDRKITLYSGPDGFVPHYKGGYTTEEVLFTVDRRGTDIRETIAAVQGGSEDFRAGVIYALGNLPSRTYFTVDMVCYRVLTPTEFEIVLVRKNSDGNRWRLPGGFLGPSDPSLEVAARRELLEETGVVAETRPEYICSTVVNDWRSRGAPDVRHMTALFAIPYTQGPLTARDDVDDIRWFNVPTDHIDKLFHIVAKEIVPEHVALVREAVEFVLATKLTNNREVLYSV